ncbi:hypothetical protein [Sinorhizobium meliloti]|uniref:hypothetical protein n=1 Tax=Rhizobium meliloti TaxID=382 RepID=UPI000B4A1A93|nr:hypothetical protein [Sinorhizobium meliloti]ASQ11076.1 hypothetical protein CDO22_13495 [Sinorhizobium meliloti]MQU85751.1 hypothetical protein [Sinorhizobium meliloti]MQU89287.1 hypothetical protein [Sinorhizobium meliloti]
MALFSRTLKVYRRDLIRAGLGSNWTIDKMIREGIIRKPHKDGPEQQSRVWWWADEIEEDIERWRHAHPSSAKDEDSAAA